MNNPGQTDLYPLPNMPRMGRRNAISYPSRILTSDDDGAFSPMNLLQTASISDIDPQGAIAQELQFQKRNQQKFKGGVPPAPVASVLDGWKKLHDAKNHTYNGIERLFEQTGPLAISMSVMEAKPVKSHAENVTEKQKEKVGPAEKEKVGHATHRGNVVIPWRKQDIKPTTIAEESVEPPETPQVSELTLRKMSKRNKRRRKGSKKTSSESVPLSMTDKTKDSKAPYSDIQPKVNTRWDQGKTDEHHTNQQDSKQKSHNVPDAVDKSKPKKSPEKPSASARPKNEDVKSFALPPNFPVIKQTSNTENRIKLVTNYPAAEKVKFTTDKLPLTIPPRYNKKALGLTGNTKANKVEEEVPSKTKLFGTLPRVKHEAPKPPTGNTLQNTFFNLQKINNVGTKGNAGTAGTKGTAGAAGTNKGNAGNALTAATAGTSVKKRASSTGQLVLSRYSANILGTAPIGSKLTPVRKNTPLVTTIQAPQSAFLTSKISVQSQMMDIPINGARIAGASTNRNNKRDYKNETKTAKPQPPKPNTTTKAKTTGPPQPQPQPAKITQPPAKVVPMLGKIPNKYNNIYIGPYSGSESEGESQTPKKKR